MQRKQGIACLAATLLVASGAGVAVAELCSPDPVPAATLLVPYFEVDYQNPGTVNTRFTVRNTEPTPGLAHLTLWTDWGAPTLDFDLFLTGYGIEEVDLYALFVDGDLPVTADEQTDPMDTISPHGRPEWDGSFAECQNFLPYPPMVIPPALRERIQQAHTGQPVDSLGGDCLGGPQGDGLVRGYITIDSVSECNLLFPSDPGYFAEGGTGVANNDNRFTGEARIVNPAAGQASTIPIAHVEADSGFTATSGATFYGRFHDNDGRDDREPLASAWSINLDGPDPISLLPPLPGGAEFIVWRDPGAIDPGPSGTGCDAPPDWLPLQDTQGVCFGPDNEFVSACFGRDCFPRLVNRTPVSDFGLPFGRGFCHFNLNLGCPDCTPGGGGSNGFVNQSFVAVRTTIAGEGGSSRVQMGTALASACTETSPIVATGELFADGFERGDTSAWN